MGRNAKEVGQYLMISAEIDERDFLPRMDCILGTDINYSFCDIIFRDLEQDLFISINFFDPGK